MCRLKGGAQDNVGAHMPEPTRVRASPTQFIADTCSAPAPSAPSSAIAQLSERLMLEKVRPSWTQARRWSSFFTPAARTPSAVGVCGEYQQGEGGAGLGQEVEMGLGALEGLGGDSVAEDDDGKDSLEGGLGAACDVR